MALTDCNSPTRERGQHTLGKTTKPKDNLHKERKRAWGAHMKRLDSDKSMTLKETDMNPSTGSGIHIDQMDDLRC